MLFGTIDSWILFKLTGGIHKTDYTNASRTMLYNINDLCWDKELCNMLDIPMNSLKAYYGHTLGAAGMIESIISMQSIRENVLIKSLGFKEQGTTHKMNVLVENKETKVDCILKSASGFGGCNAALIIKKW